MKFFRRFFERSRHYVKKRRAEAEMNEEMGLHLEHRASQLRAAGLPEKEAALAALKQFGGLEQVKEECREQRNWVFIDRVIADCVYSVRRARKTPGFTAIAIATLAVCLSANLIIFSVVDSILLRPLPFANEDRLVTLYDSYYKAGLDRNGSSLTSYYERRGNIPALASLAAYRFDQADVGATGLTERIDVLRVSPEFFATLGVTLAAGRSFDEKEMTHETDDVIVITDRYSREHFDGTHNSIGKDVRIDGSPKRIVGILPPGFRFLSYRADFYLPLSSNAKDRSIDMRHHSGGVETFARLKPGATIGEAQLGIRAHYLLHAHEYGNPQLVEQMGFHTVVVSLRDDYVASFRPTLLFVQMGGFCLLVIGAVNFINLLLIRASNRTKELAVRQALGAQQWMIFGDAVIDTSLLTGMAGLIAVCAGASMIYFFTHFTSIDLPLNAELAFDRRLATITFLTTLALGIVLAIPIASFNVLTDPAKALQTISRGGGVSRAVQQLRYASIIAQIAIAFTLLSSAGLLSLSLARAMEITPGFSEEKSTTAEVDLLGSHYNNTKERSAFVNRLVESISDQPGITAVGFSSNVPMSGKKSYNRITIDGFQTPPGAPEILHYTYFISGDYFKAMGIPLKEGRTLETKNNEREASNCVVDENFANRYWPKTTALGHRVYYGPEAHKDEAFTIVGVVGAVKQTSLTDDHNNGAIYFSYEALSDKSNYIILRSSRPSGQLGVSLAKWVRAVDPEIPISNIGTMEMRLADSVGSRRWPAILTGVFATLGLLLTLIGTYGVVSYTVVQRRREIGIRLALGAQPSQIKFQFLRLGLKLLALGAAFGLIGAWVDGKFIDRFLFNVPVLHGPTLFTTFLVLLAILIFACWWPARRAASLNPALVLSEE